MLEVECTCAESDSCYWPALSREKGLLDWDGFPLAARLLYVVSTIVCLAASNQHDHKSYTRWIEMLCWFAVHAVWPCLSFITNQKDENGMWHRDVDVLDGKITLMWLWEEESNVKRNSSDTNATHIRFELLNSISWSKITMRLLSWSHNRFHFQCFSYFSRGILMTVGTIRGLTSNFSPLSDCLSQAL